MPICPDCKKITKSHHPGRCVRCYGIFNRRRALDTIPEKSCGFCDNPIRFKKGGHLSNFRKKKTCSVKCWRQLAINTKFRNGWTPSFFKVKTRLPLEELNKAFSQTKNYTAMGRMFGVTEKTIRRWLGLKRDLLNPRETIHHTTFNTPKIKTKLNKTRKGLIDKTEYLKKYYLNKIKNDPKLLQKRRTTARLWARENR